MGRFFLGFLTPILLILVLIMGIWVSDLLGLIKINTLALEMVSFLPGLKNVTEDYELGKKRSAVLLEQEDHLRKWENKLSAAEAKLAESTTQFENEKLGWEKQHLIKAGGTTLSNQVVTPVSDNTEAKKYLTLIGGMKPEKAATVIQKLPEDTVLLLLKQIRPAQATKILENLPSEFVVGLTKKRINP